MKMHLKRQALRSKADTSTSLSLNWCNLITSERSFVSAMQVLGYGRFEFLRIRMGELVLDPWPTTIKSVKFGAATPNQPPTGSEEFELKKETADLFARVRRTDNGVIRVLEIRGGLPFSMEIVVESDAIHNCRVDEV